MCRCSIDLTVNLCSALQLLTGKGALQQLGFETGLPIQELDGLVLFIIAFNLIAALLPAKVSSSHGSLNTDMGLLRALHQQFKIFSVTAALFHKALALTFSVCACHLAHY